MAPTQRLRDPIFDHPYRESGTSTASSRNDRPLTLLERDNRKARPVAALLGGQPRLPRWCPVEEVPAELPATEESAAEALSTNS